MNQEVHVPEVRISGFSGNWEKKNLGALAEIVRGASPRPIDDPKWFDKSSKIGWLRIRDVTEQDGRIHHLEQKISKLGECKTRVLHEPHLLLSIAASVGKPVINYVPTGVHDGFLIFQNPKFDMEFMYQWLKSFEPNWQQYGQPGSQVNLNSDIVKGHNARVPSEEEQTAIGKHFKKLDALISQHRQKHEKLIQLKEAMLEKMFPKAGERVPEIRFDGFSGEWVTTRIGDVAGEKVGGGTPSTRQEDYWEGDIPWIQSSDLSDGNLSSVKARKLITKKAVSQSATKVVPANSIAIVTRVGVGKLVLMNEEYTTSQDFLSLSEIRINPQYAVYAIWRQLKKIKNQAQGTSIKGLTKEELLGKLISYPESMEEQHKIALFFKNIDALINQHQQQITKLNTIKQACLDKMFV